jgi:hypothetical protein
MDPQHRAPEWNVLGEVDIREPGRYEIVYGNGVGVGIRLIGAPAGEPMIVGADEVAHPCRPCSCCGGCACGSFGGGRTTCRACTEYRKWAAETESLLERYLAAAGQPDAFVQTDSRTHVAGCSSLKSGISAAVRAIDAGCTHQPEWFPRVPEISREAPRRKRCAACCPDVIVPDSRGPVRGEYGRFVEADAVASPGPVDGGPT